MKWLKLAAAPCLAAIVAIACSANIKPADHSIKTPSVPTTESILELFDVLQFDNIADEMIDLERGSLTGKLRSIRANGRFTPNQTQILDEFIANALSVLDEELNVDRVREILVITVQQSFSQRDIDALTIFYRTRPGKSVLAQYPQAFRTYFKARQAARNASNALNDGQGGDAALPPVFGAFFKPWENREFADFFNSDVGQDIIARFPTASRKYDEEVENVEQEVAIRERQLVNDFQAKMKAAQTQ